ncbi:MAG: hypothetical protein HZB39_15145 [Planctomycetes bacterium]|nr:hypothetical protein [Planctomycetota bacterium]
MLSVVLVAAAAVPVAAQTGASIVIRSDPSLMTLTRDALSSLLSSRRLQPLAELLGEAARGANVYGHVAQDDATLQPVNAGQPAGVFVGVLYVGVKNERGGEIADLPAETCSELLARAAAILEQQLRERLELAPLERLRAQSAELRKRLDEVAARRRAATSGAELNARRDRLEDERALLTEEAARYEVELASETAMQQRLEEELARVTKLAEAGREPASQLDRVQAELATTTARLQRLHATIQLSRTRLVDWDSRLDQLRKSQESGEDSNLLAAEFDRVANALARVEERIASFRPLEFEIWR